ncbi:MAG: helix-turn-helix domain-containing protein [Clostridia bacterium]|nr:helix-turn-helix domain-containing protein [Clostridia bacterium]
MILERAEGCEGCDYWKPLSSDGGQKACHYALMTHRCRLIPADKCPYNKTSDSFREEEKTVEKNETDWILALNLYRDGKTDKQISEAIGVSSQAVCNWRKKNGYPPNGSGSHVNKKTTQDEPAAEEKHEPEDPSSKDRSTGPRPSEAISRIAGIIERCWIPDDDEQLQSLLLQMIRRIADTGVKG